MTLPFHWTCLGKPPQIAPCGAVGTTDKGAADHTDATQHATLTGTNPAALARAVERVGGGA